MKLLKLFSVEDYEALPMTKWKIKQPNPDDVNRENPMMTGTVYCDFSVKDNFSKNNSLEICFT